MRSVLSYFGCKACPFLHLVESFVRFVRFYFCPIIELFVETWLKFSFSIVSFFQFLKILRFYNSNFQCKFFSFWANQKNLVLIRSSPAVSIRFFSSPFNFPNIVVSRLNSKVPGKYTITQPCLSVFYTALPTGFLIEYLVNFKRLLPKYRADMWKQQSVWLSL